MSNTNKAEIIKEIPIWKKSNLTLEEAAAYSNIGINKISVLSSSFSLSDFAYFFPTGEKIIREEH